MVRVWCGESPRAQGQERVCSPFDILRATATRDARVMLYQDHQSEENHSFTIYILRDLGVIMQFIQESYIALESGDHRGHFMLLVFKIAS